MFRYFIENQSIVAAGTTFSKVLDLTQIGGDNVEATLDVASLSGTGITMTITPQYSYDQNVWYDVGSTQDFTDVTNATVLPYYQTIKLPFTGRYIRFKYLIAGTTPNITFTLSARAAVGGGGAATSSGGGGGGTVAISQTGTDNDVDVISVTPGTTATNLGKAEDTVHTSGDVGIMSLGVRKDTAVSLAGTDGDYVPPVFGASGHMHIAEGFTSQAEDNSRGVIKTVNAPLADGTYAWVSDSSSALEASSIVKASPGTIRLFSGNIDPAAASNTYYLQFFNSTTVPVDGTAIAANFIAPSVIKHTNGTPTPINLDFTDNCKSFTTGLVWCISTTAYTKTITGAIANATVLYK